MVRAEYCGVDAGKSADGGHMIDAGYPAAARAAKSRVNRTGGGARISGGGRGRPFVPGWNGVP